jgi:RNA polymerase sigma factor (TIGR02999 family)
MPDVTQILNAIDAGDPRAAEQLLPLVYDELRKLAAAKLAHEKPGQTLDATALVHEAYVRLVLARNASEGEPPSLAGASGYQFANRRHFFAAAAEAMRRILIEQARRKKRGRHGGGRQRVDLDRVDVPQSDRSDDVMAVDEHLNRLAAEEPDAAAVVKLRFFAGLTAEQAAEVLGISLRTANRHWAFAKAWLADALGRVQ